MVIKDAKKCISARSVQKKDKTKKTSRDLLVIVIDEDAQVGLPAKGKGEKKKRPVERNNPKKKKKKKKKKLDCKLKDAACIDLPITIRSSSDTELIKKVEPPKALKKKRKRGFSCERESSPEIPSRGQTTECQEANVPDTCGGDNEYNTKRRKKKKKKKKHKLACSVILSQAEDDYSKKDFTPTMKTVSHEILSRRKQTLVQNARSKGKKKRKKNWKEEVVDFLLTSVGNQENHPAVSTEAFWTIKSARKQETPGLIQNSRGDCKGPKKKKICTRVANDDLDLLEGSEGAFDGRGKATAVERARKKVKKSKKEQDGAASVEGGSFPENTGQPHPGKKRRARKSKGREGPKAEPSPKQAKIKREAKERDDEIQVVAIKKGNCDEVRIDKSRRRALQEEIDRESGKTNSTKERDDSNHHFGQWSTATFDSAEQKTKFLRLLGGFKKGPASTQEVPANVMKRNMALTRHGEEKLQQSLQAEFEKAASWKRRQGAGLGFQPVPQKHMYIDKHASRSIKFED